MPADFNFYINRQGARGRQGIQGEQGFSPVITVNKNTASEYTLNIETIDGVFETENLKSNPLVYVEGAGNYVMYDPSTNTIYNSDVPDELVLKTDLATTEDPGIIQIADAEDIAESATDVAVTPKQLNDAIAGVEGEIPTDYVDLTSPQNISGVKTFSSRQEFNNGIRINSGNDIMFYKSSDTVPNIYLTKSSDKHLVISTGIGDAVKLLNATDVDGNTVWINSQGQLSARGEEFPNVIDGGIVYPALKTFTITTSNQDITISDSSVGVTDDTAGTSTISINSSTVRSEVTITINYENNSIDSSNYTLEIYDGDLQRWVSQSIGARTDVINDDNRTANIAGMTFTLNPDTLTITVS